jgi:hypothetical protein
VRVQRARALGEPAQVVELLCVVGAQARCGVCRQRRAVRGEDRGKRFVADERPELLAPPAAGPEERRKARGWKR